MAGHNLGPARVLIVDDNAASRESLREQLLAWKLSCATSATGTDALRQLRAAAATGQTYHLVLLDREMPGIDGLALAHAIKADRVIAPARLIILASLGHALTAEEQSAAKIDGCLVKPIKQARLLDCLTDVIRRNRADDTPASANETSPNGGTTHPRRLRVLLAEDNLVNQKVALGQLRSLGCTVDIAANGNEVITAVERNAYDLVLMDCQMPEMDGYAATREIRRREQEPNGEITWKPPLYIVAMTANAMQGDRDKCLAAGMNDYVSKPARIVELQAALKNARRVIDSTSRPA
jgi:two-component system, sensor histidine kinase and response regulator